MAKIIVDVMPKPVLLDPQGKAVGNAVGRLGYDALTSVRVGKRFEITLDGPVTDALLEEARNVAEQLFANPAIEDVVSVTAVEA